MAPPIHIIGGGLAGSEAAWQAAERGARVRLYEMRPEVPTPAHQTGRLGEIVCSNSLKSDEPGTAPYLLKEELRRAGSVVLDVAMRTRVPAGAALAVDRQKFAELITERIESHPNITLVREEVTAVDEEAVTVIAAGPLCSDALAEEIARLTEGTGLYFYDAIAPIVAADSVDTNVAFRAARYGKGGDDYLNCPMNGEEYARFYEALVGAQSVPLQRFEQRESDVDRLIVFGVRARDVARQRAGRGPGRGFERRLTARDADADSRALKASRPAALAPRPESSEARRPILRVRARPAACGGRASS